MWLVRRIHFGACSLWLLTLAILYLKPIRTGWTQTDVKSCLSMFTQPWSCYKLFELHLFCSYKFLRCKLHFSWIQGSIASCKFSQKPHLGWSDPVAALLLIPTFDGLLSSQSLFRTTACFWVVKGYNCLRQQLAIPCLAVWRCTLVVL